MGFEFSEVITTEAQFRGVIGSPNHRVLRKQVAALDDHCRAFIAKSPFLLISSCDGKGNMDVSPKGDPPGFVRVLDDETLAIPDRPGNRRADTFCNLLANPNVGLCSWYPGSKRPCGLMELLSLCGTNGSANRWAWLASSPSLRS